MSPEERVVVADEESTADPTETGPTMTTPSAQTSSSPVSVLLVGTLGGGGIDHFVSRLASELDAPYKPTIFDMGSDPKGSGVIWLMTSIVRSLLALLRFPFRRRPDIVHVHASQHWSFYRAAPYVLIASMWWRRPVVLHIHGSSFDDFLAAGSAPRRWVQDLVFETTDEIVVLSEYWSDVLTDRVDANNVHCVPNAVDPVAFETGREPAVPTIAFVSSLIERKGIEELLEAVRRLEAALEPSFEVVIAGAGPLEDTVTELADDSSCIEYRGYVDESEKQAILASSSVFALPTHAEGLPIALLEAMAGGNAIVSTPVGGIPELVDDEGGTLVEPGDVDGLRWALQELIVSPSTAASMGRYNRSRIEQRYTWEHTTNRLEHVYERARSSSPRPTQGQSDRTQEAPSATD